MIPTTQHAVQLVGPNKLLLNKEKPVPTINDEQILCRVVVVGLCFSDLKLLQQFSHHPRKSPVLEGIDPAVLAENPCYVPDEKATVPGHEPVIEIVKTGAKVRKFRVGERYFIQADWRHLPTANSKGAFGYNFEGALQEYVLLDERLIIAPNGESMLLPAPAGERSAAAFALVEPWACAEDSYQVKERTGLTKGGRLLVVTTACGDKEAGKRFFRDNEKPAEVVKVSLEGGCQCADALPSLDAAEDNSFDDILYFGSNPEVIEKLPSKAKLKALINIVLCGEKIGRPVFTPIGDVHYRNLRLIGTPGFDPAESMKCIPFSGEIRSGDAVNIVGAAGPMGVTHVIRNLSQGIKGTSVYAADLSDERLALLNRLAEPVAAQTGIAYHPYNPKTATPNVAFNYHVIMAPVPALVAAAITNSAPGGIINVFAGVAAGKGGETDLDAYIRKGLYMFGTSGSVMDDMRIVLGNVQSGALDTNVSVAAISGLDGAVEGIRMVERQEIPGKIMVYPQCKGLEVTRIEKLNEVLPGVAAKMNNGVWTKEAEEALLARYAG
jgi:threonine dehydrogenase-like Zn-dependent dehydrogenase